jgi:hypothetical protein
MAAEKAKFPGTPIDVGGDIGVVIVPALSLAQLEELQEKEKQDPPVRVSKQEVVKMALSRNYPPFDEGKWRTHMDLNLMGRMYDAAMGNSGLAPTRETPPGN